ncbi:hypothetical protein [Paenibacillus sp. LPE1-1-1.1]|uniref:hypothetical protein n=1 Tax=Paenibacillus sp. LPE1-1-1.1 TaxID=3135230 RepID=UPI00341417E6
MIKSILYLFMLFVIFCTACSGENEILVEKQSFVRWHEKDSILEVYIAAANKTDKEVSFEASIVMLNPDLKDAVGFETKQLETDDRNGKTPFLLTPHTETVFQRDFTTDRILTQEMLTNGVGIKITTSEESYTMPIKYGEVE